MVTGVGEARAIDVRDFYRGKTLTLTVGFSPGGAYDVYARLFARHFPKHLPGEPAVVVRNMPGAGSVVAANYIYNRATSDGTELALIAGTAAIEPLLGGTSTQFDGQKFAWLGSANREVGACFAWHTSKARTAGDLFTSGMITGSAGTSSLLVPTTLNQVLGAKLELVRGYAGTSPLMLAIERGEVEGMCGMVMAAIQAEHPDWLAKGLIAPLLQIGFDPAPALGAAPLVTDFVKSTDDLPLLRLLFGWTIMGRPFLAPPATPGDRADALRGAFEAMTRDRDFLDDARRARVDVDPIGPARIGEFLRQAYETPKPVVARANAILGASK